MKNILLLSILLNVAGYAQLVNPVFTLNQRTFLDTVYTNKTDTIAMRTFSDLKYQTKAIINVKDSGAVGDGVTDDLAVLNSCFANAEGQTIIIPEGTYIISDKITYSSSNSVVYNYGTIKAQDGIDLGVYNLFNVNADNVIFYNLIIDGNGANQVDNQAFGNQGNMVLYSNKHNITFIGGEIKNSLYCGVTFNGGNEFIRFDGMRFDNIGEHGFYLSGGSNKNCTFENLYFNNIAQSTYGDAQNHDAHLFKMRKTAYYQNYDFTFRNIQAEGNNSLVVTTAFLLEMADGVYVDGVTLDETFGGSFILAGEATDTVKNVYFRGLNKGAYNVINGNISNIYLSDSKIVGNLLYANGFDIIDNVVIENGYLQTMDLSAVNFDSSHTTLVTNSKFYGTTASGVAIRTSNLQYDLTFENCVFNVDASTYGFLIDVPSGITSGKLRFIDCDFGATISPLYGTIAVAGDLDELWFVGCDSLWNIYYDGSGATKLLIDNTSIRSNSSLLGTTTFINQSIRNLRGNKLFGAFNTDPIPEYVAYNGTSSKTIIPDNNLLDFSDGDFSINIQFKIVSKPDIGSMILSHGYNPGYSMGVSTLGKINFTIYDAVTENTILLTGDYSELDFVNYTFVHNSTTSKMYAYVDGNLLDSLTTSVVAFNSDSAFIIGYFNDTDTNFTNIKVSALSVYDTALTSLQVRTVYNNGMPAEAELDDLNPVLDYRAKYSITNYWYDQSGNNLTGTNTNVTPPAKPSSFDSIYVNGSRVISLSDTASVTDGYVQKYVSGELVWSPDISTSGSGTFNPDGTTIDTTAGGLARVLPAKVTKWDSVTAKVNIADMDVPANLIQDSLTTKLNRAELDIAPSVIQDSLTIKANTVWFAISPTLIDDSIAVKMNRSEMTGYSATSHTHIEFSDTVRVGGWSIGMGNTDLDTLIAGSFGGIKLPNDYTVTEVAAYTNSGTVTFNIEERAETTPNTSGTDVMTSDLVADTDQQETGTFSNATLDRNDWLILTIVSISGEPTIFSVTVRGVKTD